MYHPAEKIAHTKAFVAPVVEHWLVMSCVLWLECSIKAFVTPVVEHWLEREIAQWVHHEGSIRRPIAQ